MNDIFKNLIYRLFNIVIHRLKDHGKLSKKIPKKWLRAFYESIFIEIEPFKNFDMSLVGFLWAYIRAYLKKIRVFKFKIK